MMEPASCIKKSSILMLLLSLGLLAQPEHRPFEVELNHYAISPNADGKNDYLLISLKNTKEAMRFPASWECEIQKLSGKQVYLFRSDQRKKRDSPSLSNMFLPSDSSIQSHTLFKRLVWNGQIDNKVAPDGIYKVQVKITDSKTLQTWVVTSQQFIIDTKAPVISLAPRVSSINTIKSSPKLILLQRSRGKISNVFFRGQLLDFDGNLISEKKWNSKLPYLVNIFWKDLKKSIVLNNQKRFRYRLVAQDSARNKSVIEYNNLLVDKNHFQVDISSNRQYFSPNQDGLGDTIRFDIFNINSKGIRQNHKKATPFLLQILSAKEQNVVFQTKRTQLPAQIKWDGYSDHKVLQENGKYFVKVILENNANSALYPFTIHNESPLVTFSTSRTKLRIGLDNQDTSIYSNLDFHENTIVQWKVALVLYTTLSKLETGFSRIEKIYNYYEGTSEPASFVWNGFSDGGHGPSSYESFEYRYEVIDRSGNKYKGASDEIQTGLLFRPEQKGSPNLIARLPLQGYFNRNGSLTSKGQSVIDSVLAELENYGLYEVSFEVHSSSPGTEEQNLFKTEKRARGLNSYIKKRWNRETPYEYRGYGESELLDEGNDVFFHYRNERIEVRLSL